MSVLIDDFDDYFAALNNGHRPFAWQRRLVDYIVERASWPEQIAAPTGSGKSNVVDIHVFVNALAMSGTGPRVPRRLATVVDRRALVDRHFERALMIRDELDGACEDSVLCRVRVALNAGSADGKQFLRVVNMRGGLGQEVSADGAVWLDDPVTCSLISATPAMWGSRLLFRGYGSSRGARPREAGLLALDAAMVLDEAHLNAQLLYTAQRIAVLTAGEAAAIGVPGLQVVQTTATPDAEVESSVGVFEDDLADDSVLAARLRRPKPLKLVEAVEWPGKGKPSDKHIAQLVDEVQQLRAGTSGVVGCLVNRVDTAVAVAAALRKFVPNVECWVGRRRPVDVQELVEKHKVLFDSEAPQSLDVLVATQTVEVGVDLDLAGMVTELAPGSAIAQRVGRVNRRGRREVGPITVIVPGSVSSEAPPYLAEELDEALAWLSGLPAGASLSPWALRSHRPPGSKARRAFLKRPERYDSDRWALTSIPLVAEEALELWLAEDLESEAEPCALVIRGPLPRDENQVIALLQAVPATTDEAFPVKIGDARKILARVLAGDAGDDRRAWLLRDGEIVTATSNDRSGAQRLRPGDTIIVPDGLALTIEGVATAEALKPESGVNPTQGTAFRVLVRDQAEAEDLDLLWELDDADDSEASALVRSLPLAPPDAQVTVSALNDAGEISWAVIASAKAEADDTRQLWTPSGQPVALSSHGSAVHERAADLVARLGLAEEAARAVIEGARWHDAGKADGRFQHALGARGDSQEALAKSGLMNAQQVRRSWRLSGLPSGWRHEFLSAALAWDALADDPLRGLICRLVGTSHGHGRGVPGQVSTLAESDAGARAAVDELFWAGGWDSLLKQTHGEWGVWGCAYLEALVRAADCTVSREGR